MYFKDTNNGLHFLSDADIEAGGELLLPPGCVQMTDAEATIVIAAMSVSPDPVAFSQAVKSGVGGILAANALMVAYPAFFPAIETGQWNDLATLILDAQSKNVITSAQYAAMKTAAALYNIPVTLP